MKANSDFRPLEHHLINLAKKIFLTIAAIWVSLYVFEAFLAPHLGITHFDVQITNTVAIIALSIVIIMAVRRLVKRTSAKIGQQLSATISFFIILAISLIAALAIMHQWQVDIQSVLIGGGVAAIIIGIGLSTIMGNILSGGLVLTTFPAKIGDSIFIPSDNIHGTVGEVNFMYTKILVDSGSEYIVPNNAIVQGGVRFLKETRVVDKLPFATGEYLDLVAGEEKYGGIVKKISPQFTHLVSEAGKETILSNTSILSGKYVMSRDASRQKPS